MKLPARFALLVAFLGVLLAPPSAFAALQFSSSSYPQRSNNDVKQIATVPFDKNSGAAGVSRADCLDVTQEWRFFYLGISVPAEATTVDIWAQLADDTSTNCDDPSARGVATGSAQTCWRVASFPRSAVVGAENPVVIHPYQIIAAIDKHLDGTNTSLVNASTADSICTANGESQVPQGVVLWSVPMVNPTTVVAGTSIGTQTAYDIAGPPAPTDVTLGAGSTIINAHFSFNATAYSDFAGLRAFCWPKAGFDGGIDSGATTTDTGAPDTFVAADTESADATEDGAIDTGTAAVDTGTTDGGTTSPTGTCPADNPLQEGQYPPGNLEPCANVTQTAQTITLTGLINGQPYAVAIASFDKFGNSGKLSSVACVTPKDTLDFYDAYRAAGGKAGGGYCAFSASTAVPIGFGVSVFGLALVGRFARRRSRR